MPAGTPDLPREQPPGRWTHHFEVTPEFSEQLRSMVPGAVARLHLLERGIKHVLDREIEEYREGREHPRIRVVEGDEPILEGLLLTEPGFPDVPECMVRFEFHADFERSRVVTLWGLGRTPALDEIEDYTGDP